ncbi:hypothetical protein BRC83_05230 [Halobacteriales archaeon QS_1_68_17]|nr:MAG: hypothetical protein BRC83_05230 [Halobacteriales archaeon QS_1_68_17]
MPDSDRGLSDLLGFVFVFALVAATVGIISTAGFDSLREAREAEQLQNAERAFDVLVDNIEDIHRRGAPSRGTEIDVTDGSIYVGDPVTFNVSGTDTSTGNSFVVEREVHPIVYEESGDTRLRYAGGAVIREENQGSVVLEEPPFLLGADGVVVPVIRTTPTRVINVGGGTILLRTLHEGTTIEEASGDLRHRLPDSGPRQGRLRADCHPGPGLRDGRRNKGRPGTVTEGRSRTADPRRRTANRDDWNCNRRSPPNGGRRGRLETGPSGRFTLTRT